MAVKHVGGQQLSEHGLPSCDTGAPNNVRFDNGPEFVAHAVHDWCRVNSAGSRFIDPSSPWENAWIEPRRTAQLMAPRLTAGSPRHLEDSRCDYNANRSHSASANSLHSSSLYRPAASAAHARMSSDWSPRLLQARQPTSRGVRGANVQKKTLCANEFHCTSGRSAAHDRSRSGAQGAVMAVR